MGGMRAWTVCTGAAILLIPLIDAAARLATPGWIFVFVFVYGSPVWLLSYGALVWLASGMLSPRGSFAGAPKRTRSIVILLLWVYLAGLTIFCWFTSDGGDADDWQSPAGLVLGTDGYNSSTPEYLNRAQDIAGPALLIGFAALIAAVIVYGVVRGPGNRRGSVRLAEIDAASTD